MDNEIKLLKDTMQTKRLQKLAQEEDNHLQFFTRKQIKFFSFEPEEPISQFEVVQAMTAKTKYVDIYNSRFFLIFMGNRIQLVDFSGGIILDQRLEERIHLVTVSQETKQLPSLFILTPKGDVVHYQLNNIKTNKRNNI